MKIARKSIALISTLSFAVAVAAGTAPIASAAAPQDFVWTLSNAFGGTGDVACTYGAPGDVAVSGDWNGDGVDSPGVFRNGMWYLSNACGGTGDYVFQLGQAGDIPIVGDWNGDGIDTPGVFRGSEWFLSGGFGGSVDRYFIYGVPTDRPVVGDWNGDGTTTVGIFRDSLWHLSDTFGQSVDYNFSYGAPGDVPVVGDWNADGRSTPGIARYDEWWLTDSFGGMGNHVFTYGVASDQRLVGDWDGNGTDTPGVARSANPTNPGYISSDVDARLALVDQIPASVMDSQQSIDNWLFSQGVNVNDRGTASCLAAIGVAIVTNIFVVGKLTKVKAAFKELGGTAAAMSRVRTAYSYYRGLGYSRTNAIQAAVNNVFSGKAVLAEARVFVLDALSVQAVIEKCL